MKKILISLALVLFMSIGVYAQLTPEGVMAALPDLLTLAQMIAYETEEQDPDLYSDFHAKLSEGIRTYRKPRIYGWGPAAFQRCLQLP